jgi:site-specific recombinase XerD
VTDLTLIEAARIMREAVRDKSYREMSLGEDAAAYLRSFRRRATDRSYGTYESVMDKLCRYFHGLELADLEPPIGTQRIEEFLEREWGEREPSTYNRGLTVTRGFLRFARRRGLMHADPTEAIERAKIREVYHESFSPDEVAAIFASNPERRDQVALWLTFHLGIRKASLLNVRFEHFDHFRKRLTIWGKGGKVRSKPIPDPAFWHELERLIVESEAQPGHYLLQGSAGNDRVMRYFPDRPMGHTSHHRWFYACQERAGVVEKGQRKGSRPHKARHTAGQKLIDATGNLKAVQQLLDHSSVATTGDMYVGWDEAALAASLQIALEKESFQADD